MKTMVLFFTLLPMLGHATCHHHLIKHNKNFACVTMANNSKHALSITSLSGVSKLPSGTKEEVMLTLANKGKIKLVPHPPIPHFNKMLSCAFPVAEARKTAVIVTYYNNDTAVVSPASMKQYCKFTNL